MACQPHSPVLWRNSLLCFREGHTRWCTIFRPSLFYFELSTYGICITSVCSLFFLFFSYRSNLGKEEQPAAIAKIKSWPWQKRKTIWEKAKLGDAGAELLVLCILPMEDGNKRKKEETRPATETGAALNR